MNIKEVLTAKVEIIPFFLVVKWFAIIQKQSVVGFRQSHFLALKSP